MSALQRAIQKLGSQAALGKSIGCTQSRISMWLSRGTLPDPPACVAIEKATAGAVTRQDLRPDDWQAIWPELTTPKRRKAEQGA